MLRDVTITVSDGQISQGNGDGVHVKIGVSPVLYTEPIAIKGDMTVKRIREALGLSPLADACMDSVENGANLTYCIPGARHSRRRTGNDNASCATRRTSRGGGRRPLPRVPHPTKPLRKDKRRTESDVPHTLVK